MTTIDWQSKYINFQNRYIDYWTNFIKHNAANTKALSHDINNGLKLLDLLAERDSRLFADTLFVFSDYLIDGGYYQKGLQLFRSIYDTEIAQNNEISRQVDFLFKFGQFYRYSSQYEEATKYYKQGLELSENSHVNQKTYISLYCELGLMNQFAGRAEDALDCYNKSVQTAQKQELLNTFHYVFANVCIAHIWVTYGRMDEAERLLLDLLGLIDIKNQLKELSLIYAGLGSLNMHRGLLEKGIDYALKALQIEEQLDIRHLQTRSLLNLAIAHQYLLHFSDSEKYFQRAIQIAKDLGYIGGLARFYREYANFFYDLGQPENSLKFIDEAIQFATQTGLDKFRLYDLKAKVLIDLDQLDEAESLLADTSKHAEETKNPTLIIQNLYQKGKLKAKQNKAEESDMHFQQSYDLATEKLKSRLRTVLMEWGLRKLDIDDFDKAKELLSQAVSLSDQGGRPVEISFCLFGLAKIELAEHHPEGAKNYLDSAMEIVSHSLEHPLRASMIDWGIENQLMESTS